MSHNAHAPHRVVRGVYSAIATLAVAVSAACSDDRSPATAPTAALAPVAAKAPKIVGKIAFVRGPADATSIWIMAGDGTAASRVTPDGRFDDPALSADGKRLAYVQRDDQSVPTIVLANANGTGAKSLTIGEWPRWSPDGTKILFQRFVETKFQVFVINATGTNLRQLTTTPDVAGFHPSWSADGRRVVFVSDLTKTPELFVMDADGTDQTRITDCAAEGTFCVAPAWSPDLSDDRIAYAIAEPISEIRTIRPDGTGRKTVFADPSVGITVVTWSPDAARIAFDSSLETPGFTQVFSVFRDGTDLRRLTFGQVPDARPNWSR